MLYTAFILSSLGFLSGVRTQQADSNWRNSYFTGTASVSCYTRGAWDSSICRDGPTCAKLCALDGAEYQSKHGIATSGNVLTMKFVTKYWNDPLGATIETNVGSRVYLTANNTRYQMFNLLNKEFTFDVEMSSLFCGVKGAVYFVQMDADGGMARFPDNKAGAMYGTGYCDAQCPRDIKFINGEGNVRGWGPFPNDINSGQGNYGTCCSEMDIWEGNSISMAYTAHPCRTQNSGGQERCTGQQCGTPMRYDSPCDPDGCDFNSFRLGDRNFYGPPGQIIETSGKRLTVVTQFLTHDNTTTGTLSEIRRIYVQAGRIIQNSNTNFPSLPLYNSITDKFCDDTKNAFGDTLSFQKQGGLAQMGASLAKGHVLALSIWHDHTANLLWLDSDYPADADPRKPGVARGTCPTTSGNPKDVQDQNSYAQVIFANIKFGDIGTTYSAS